MISRKFIADVHFVGGKQPKSLTTHEKFTYNSYISSITCFSINNTAFSVSVYWACASKIVNEHDQHERSQVKHLLSNEKPIGYWGSDVSHVYSMNQLRERINHFLNRISVASQEETAEQE